MGAYAYCRACDAPLTKPTVREALCQYTAWTCGRGHPNDPSGYVTIEEIVIEQEDRLAALELRLGVDSH
jgi:hypothetical protein